MRFHLPALPGRPITRSNSSCAYTGKVRRFATMMRDLGHEVFIYGGGGFDGRASAYVACYPDTDPLPFDAGEWREANLRAAAEIVARAEKGDFLCLIGGQAQQAVATAVPEMMAVEYGVGYAGVFADYRVFESYAWMHMVYGSKFENPMSGMGTFYDAVIPNYFHPAEFDVGTLADKEGYVLYLGRVIDRKGVRIAEEAAKKAGVRLLIAGPDGGEEKPEYGEVLGEVDPDERRKLLAGATALLCPTRYVEPFGGVAIEAMMSGTPVITTDWGAYTETVQPGVNGWRCRTLGEFVWAVQHAGDLSPERIAAAARKTYSMEAIAPRYERYFERLRTLNGVGWPTEWEGLSQEAPPLGSTLSRDG